MANRNFANGGKIYAMHVAVVLSNTNITIGSTGAVSSFIGTLTSSVVRISTGIYQINLADSYNALMSAQGSAQSPSSGLSGVLAIEIQNAPSTSVASFPSPSLTIKCLDAAGALVDPASGSVISINAFLLNSAVKA